MLTDAQIKSAIDYNRTQWKERNVDTRRIQWATATYPDGLWGPNTINAIATWQDNNALSVDGKWGPASNAAYWDGIYPVFGLWSSRTGDEWDAHFVEYVNAIFAAGISEIVLEVNDDSDDGFKLSQWEGGEAQLIAPTGFARILTGPDQSENGRGFGNGNFGFSESEPSPMNHEPRSTVFDAGELNVLA